MSDTAMLSGLLIILNCKIHAIVSNAFNDWNLAFAQITIHHDVFDGSKLSATK